MASRGSKTTSGVKNPIFMPPSNNPMVDSKKSSNRRLVAKWAMKNRPKPALETTSPPGAATTNGESQNSISPPIPLPPTSRSSQSTSPSHNSSSPESQSSVNGHPVFPSEPQNRGSVSNSYKSDSSPHVGFGLLARGTSDYYTLDHPDLSIKTRAPRKLDEANSSYSESSHSVRESYSPSDDSDVVSTIIESCELDHNDINADDLELDVDFAMSQHSSSINGSSSEIDFPLGTYPLTILDTNRNPFDCLPIERSDHTMNLIEFYLTGCYLSPTVTQGSVEIPTRIKTYRQQIWFPLARDSKVLMHALMAYIESTPGNPIPSGGQVYLLENVQAAYSGMRQRLENKKAQTDDSICMAVLLLMLTAQRIGDIHTFRRHAQGLRILLRARATALKHDKLLRDQTESKWQGLDVAISGPPNPNPCKYCQDSHLRPASRSPSPQKDEIEDEEQIVHHPETDKQAMNGVDPSTPIALRGQGFRHLIGLGYMSPVMSNFVEEALIMAELAEHTRHDKLSAAAAVSHAWIDERSNSLPPFDTACQLSARLCLYLSTWLERGHNCSVVRRFVGGVYMCLRHPLSNVENLLLESPLVLLWLALAAGPLVEDGEAARWFSCLLARARDATYLEFNQAIQMLGSYFVWIRTMTPGARRFWNENTWDVGAATSAMQNTGRR